MKKIAHHYYAVLQPAENYQLVSGLFLKLLALVYLAAFFSLGVQITGLVGADGILPFAQQLDFSYQNNGVMAWFHRPTLFWFDSSNFSLQAVAFLGCAISIVLFFGFKPVWSLISLFVLYVSLFHAGQTFLSFQWDTLLLEAGFLSIFLTRGPNHLLLFMFHWLLFRLRFMSGLSKFAGGDPSWAGFTTLNYYFETQPLPHVGAWYFHQLPEWMLQFGVALVFFTELIVPFFIFLPRKFRLFAASTTIVMQLLIIATSNHNWINLLTIVLCLFLLDDDVLKKIVPNRWHAFINIDSSIDVGSDIRKRDNALPVFSFLILFSSAVAFSLFFTNLNVPEVVARPSAFVRAWGIGHVFHVFPTMQTERHELVIEGSYDGKEWKSYVFKYKPESLDEAPAFIVPHQPRLDWMIWFVPPKNREMLYWFEGFLYRLHKGSEDVLDLLRYNPFPDKPPNYLRVQVYQYWFTTSDERERTGNWWRREYMGEFPYVRPRRP